MSSRGGGAAAEAVRAALFTELMQECKHSAPGARLSANLRFKLERLCPAERRALCSRSTRGYVPLCVASRRDCAETAEYLLHVCGAELEQRGIWQAPARAVTPLWIAAAAGRLRVLRVLADAGADLDARCDAGCTPLRAACAAAHEDAVRELLARGADVRRAGHAGDTCLMAAVQSARLCALLLDAGAVLDARDVRRETALHRALRERRTDTVRLLLAYGADPRLASRAGDDALRTAALAGAADELGLLLAEPCPPYAAARVADAYELLGATQLERGEARAAMEAWRHATALRHGGAAPVPKRPARPARGASAALGGAREWRTPAELEALEGDLEGLRAQALLVAARVLGAAHEETLARFVRRGAAEADAFGYRRCVDLWSWALRARVRRDTMLHADAAQAACALTRLLLDAHAGRFPRADGLHADVRRAFALVARGLPECRSLLALRPQHRAQAEAFDCALRCATHLLHLLLDTAAPGAERAAAARRARSLVAADVRSAGTGDSLLHLCASRLNVVPSDSDPAAPPPFPCVRAVRALLRAGADARVRNAARCTPLHVAAIPCNFSTELVLALVEGGAHLDAPNRFGDSPAELVALNRDSRVCVLRHVTLACLAARALAAHARARAPVPGALPRTLHEFLDLHRP